MPGERRKQIASRNEAYEAVVFNAVEKFYIGDDAREVSERDDTEIVRENKSLMQALSPRLLLV